MLWCFRIQYFPLNKDIVHEMEQVVVHNKTLDPTYTLAYDANGNPTQVNAMTLTWDADNRLTRFDDGANPVTFTYDWAGARVKKSSLSGSNISIGDLFEVRGGQIIKHIFAGSQRIASLVGPAPSGGGGGGFSCTPPKGCSLGQHMEPTWQDVINLLPFLLLLAGMGIVRGRLHPKGFLRKRPLYKTCVLLLASIVIWSAWPPMPAEAQTTETVLYYHTDHLGSSSLITDDQGLIVQRISFTPFGALRQNNSITADVPYKFTGTELDAETGLYHMGARYYSPLLGRFLSPDPVVPDAANPQSFNRYGFVLNNPLRYVDPTGYSMLSDALESVGDWFQKNVVDPVVKTAQKVGNWFQQNVINPITQSYEDLARDLKVQGWFDVGDVWDWLSLVGLLAIIGIAVYWTIESYYGAAWPILALTLIGAGYGLMDVNSLPGKSRIQKAFFGALIGFGIGSALYLASPDFAGTFALASTWIFIQYIASKGGVNLPSGKSGAPSLTSHPSFSSLYESSELIEGSKGFIDAPRPLQDEEDTVPGYRWMKMPISIALIVTVGMP